MSNSGITPREIDLPFRVDGTGGIGFTTDLGQQTKNHLFSVVGTQIGERVMRGDYGANLMPHLWNVADDVALERLKGDLVDAVRQFAPEVNLTDVDLTVDLEAGIVNAGVRFTLANDNEQIITISTPLPTA